MKLVENYPQSYLGRRIIQLNKNDVTVTYKSLRDNYCKSFGYGDFDPSFTKSQTGDSSWSNFSLFIFIISIATETALRVFGKIFENDALTDLSLGILSVGVIASSFAYCKQFVKSEYLDVRLLGSTRGSFVSIKIVPSSQAFIQELTRRIEEAGNQPEQKPEHSVESTI